ncbi:Rho GTPase-activating protein 7 [Morella rubra]|uniref:Rho GTPase-activating protein 7 n=1 Tax=Morella rubra TaxID=262757 RepID=A0A6A1VZM1_9ROSI|nr:Rho GTPase-activating protein 7 [Morella rubra]
MTGSWLFMSEFVLTTTFTGVTKSNLGEETGSLGSCTKRTTDYPSRFQLEQDVQRLQQQLQEEMELHAILEKAIQKNPSKFSSPSCLPHQVLIEICAMYIYPVIQAQELLSHIALLEVTVSKLEQEMVSLHFQLSQERNERRLAEYHLRHSSSHSTSLCSSDIMDTLAKKLKGLKTKNIKDKNILQGKRTIGKLKVICIEGSPSLRCPKLSVSVGDSLEDISCQELRDPPAESNDKCKESVIKNAVDAIALCHDEKTSAKKNSKCPQPVEFRKLPKGMPPNGLWDHPNQLSEEMVTCMKNIFLSLADSTIESKSAAPESHCSPLSPRGTSPRGHLSSSSWWSSSERSAISSWMQSPQVDIQSNSEVLASDNVCDPYRVRGKLSWVDIGNYGQATEVSWMSVGKKQLEYAAGALRKFRALVEQLAKVNPIHLSSDEKLAFWINLYNALIMHAYLAYGVPRSELKLFSLMQKSSNMAGASMSLIQTAPFPSPLCHLGITRPCFQLCGHQRKLHWSRARKLWALVEQLAKVNPIHLSSDEKLAFWINLYNALIMHAYLAYGVPRSELKLFSLMQKAAYTVGGHSFSAAAIEYVILKMKPPLHRPQIALLLAIHKLKVSEEQRKSAVDTYVPVVAFALSCGMHSSPAVRTYTAKNVREELQAAQRDFIRASVGVSSKGKLLVPKMLHSFAKGFVDDANLALWILHYLPPHQAAFLEQCIAQRRQSLLGSRSCGILPFDSRFRYLFLPDKIPL